MHKRLAIMIDATEARVVRLDEVGAFRVEHIPAEAEALAVGAATLSGPTGGVQDQSEFFERVADAVGDVRQVAVLGRKPARDELARLITSKRPGTRVVGLDGADRLTDGALVARARELLGMPLARMQL